MADAELFDYIGEIGLFQWLMCLFHVIVPGINDDSININFIAGHMDHWCDVEGINHLPHSQQKYVAIPYKDDGEYKECHCYVNNYTAYSDEELMNWNRSVMNPAGSSETKCTGWVYDQSAFYSTYSSKFDLVCSEDWKVSLLSTFYMVGYLCGTVSVGATSDTFGRKKSLFIFFTIKMVGHLISTFAPTYWFIVLGRYLLGIGAITFLPVYVTMMECVSDKYRSITANAGFVLNVIRIGFTIWSAYVVRHEVYFQLIYLGAQLVLFFFWFVIPESPRWLLVKKKYKEADSTIRRIAAINKIELPDDLELDKIVKRQKENRAKGTCLDLMRYPRMRLRTMILCLYWFTVSLLFYALQFNTGRLPGNIFINTLLVNLTDIPAAIVVLFCLNWPVLGRRWTSAGGLLVAGIINLCIIPALLGGSGTAATTLSIIGRLFVTGSFSAIYVYTAEMNPTEVRNIAMGVTSLCARVSGMVAPFAGGPLHDVWDPLPNLIFGVLGLVSGGLVLLLPETLGQPMFETVQQAESFTGKKTTPTSSTLSVLSVGMGAKDAAGSLPATEAEVSTITRL